jgi:hypothetical protein
VCDSIVVLIPRVDFKMFGAGFICRCSPFAACTAVVNGSVNIWQRATSFGPFAGTFQCGSSVSVASVFAVVGCPGNNTVLMLSKGALDSAVNGTVSNWTVGAVVDMAAACNASGDSDTDVTGIERFGAVVELNERYLTVSQCAS